MVSLIGDITQKARKSSLLMEIEGQDLHIVKGVLGERMAVLQTALSNRGYIFVRSCPKKNRHITLAADSRSAGRCPASELPLSSGR
jgi:hypothetical protein